MNNENTAGASPAKSWVRRHPKWSIFLALMAVGIVVSSLNDASSTASNPSPAPQQAVAEESKQEERKVRVGEEGILNMHKDVADCSGIVVVAKTEETHDEIVKASVANDTYAIAEMIAKDRAFSVPACSKVLVIDQGFGKRKIRVVDTGQSGWVSMEFVR